jgi:hypothetical protein
MIPVDIQDEYLMVFLKAKEERSLNNIELSNCPIYENETRLNLPESQLNIIISTASLI